jgi:hypothetical protein
VEEIGDVSRGAVELCNFFHNVVTNTGFQGPCLSNARIWSRI